MTAELMSPESGFSSCWLTDTWLGYSVYCVNPADASVTQLFGGLLIQALSVSGATSDFSLPMAEFRSNAAELATCHNVSR